MHETKQICTPHTTRPGLPGPGIARSPCSAARSGREDSRHEAGSRVLSRGTMLRSASPTGSDKVASSSCPGSRCGGVGDGGVRV